MAAFRSSALRDHLCWVWRVGQDSSDAALAEAALLAEQVLRVLGVQADSLDTMLCQVCAACFGGVCGVATKPTAQGCVLCRVYHWVCTHAASVSLFCLR